MYLLTHNVHHSISWNKGKLVGQKPIAEPPTTSLSSYELAYVLAREIDLRQAVLNNFRDSSVHTHCDFLCDGMRANFRLVLHSFILNLFGETLMSINRLGLMPKSSHNILKLCLQILRC